MLQSILFPHSKFTEIEAISWLYSHNHYPEKVHIGKKYFRFRINPPNKSKSYYSKKLPNGVILISYT
jgi:hypothetical protein